MISLYLSFIILTPILFFILKKSFFNSSKQYCLLKEDFYPDIDFEITKDAWGKSWHLYSDYKIMNNIMSQNKLAIEEIMEEPLVKSISVKDGVISLLIKQKVYTSKWFFPKQNQLKVDMAEKFTLLSTHLNNSVKKDIVYESNKEESRQNIKMINNLNAFYISFFIGCYVQHTVFTLVSLDNYMLLKSVSIASVFMLGLFIFLISSFLIWMRVSNSSRIKKLYPLHFTIFFIACFIFSYLSFLNVNYTMDIYPVSTKEVIYTVKSYRGSKSSSYYLNFEDNYNVSISAHTYYKLRLHKKATLFIKEGFLNYPYIIDIQLDNAPIEENEMLK